MVRSPSCALAATNMPHRTVRAGCSFPWRTLNYFAAYVWNIEPSFTHRLRGHALQFAEAQFMRSPQNSPVSKQRDTLESVAHLELVSRLSRYVWHALFCL